MIVDTSDTHIAILPETENDGLPTFAAWFNDKTGRAEITTDKGTYIHPCHNFTALLRHVQQCDRCSEMFLSLDDEDQPIWVLDCGYEICDSVVDYNRLFRLILEELGELDLDKLDKLFEEDEDDAE